MGNKTAFGYDDAGRLTGETDAVGKGTAYGYDDANRLVSVTDRLGRRRAFGYDAAGRKTSEAWYSPTAKVQTQTFGYDANGNLTSATDPDGSYTFTHDNLNRVVATTQPFGFAQAFTYDAADNRLTAADNMGGVTTSAYDNLDRLTSRSLSVGGANQLKAAWSYDAAGDRTGMTRSAWAGGAWPAAGSVAYAHDGLGRTTGITQKDAAGATLASYSYVLDAGDRVTSQTINGVTRTFAYDKTGQLTADGGTAYTYDKGGNRTTAGYATTAGNRLGSDGTWSYTYDANGSVSGKADVGGAWAYGYDHRGQMTSAAYTPAGGGAATTTVTYRYDALGNRIERDATGGVVERYAVDGWDTAKPDAVGLEGFDTVADLDASGGVTTRRVFGGGYDDVVARRDGSGAVGWYAADRQGSVRAVFDNAGVTVAAADYDGYGAFLGGVPVDRYAYAGREWDAALGLSYNRARMYDPKAGRWYGEDALGFAAGDSNLSRYAGNGPTNATDPSGAADTRLPKSGVHPTGDSSRLSGKAKDAAEARNRFFEGIFDRIQQVERQNYPSDRARRLAMARVFDVERLKIMVGYRVMFERLDAILKDKEKCATATLEDREMHEMLRRFFWTLGNVGYSNNGIYLQYLKIDILGEIDTTIRRADTPPAKEPNVFGLFVLPTAILSGDVETALGMALELMIMPINPFAGPLPVTNEVLNPVRMVGFMYYPDETLWGGNPYRDMTFLLVNTGIGVLESVVGALPVVVEFRHAMFALRLAPRPSSNRFGPVKYRYDAKQGDSCYVRNSKLNRDLAEFDAFERHPDGRLIAIEEKDFRRIGKINPKTGMPYEDPAAAFERQIYDAGSVKATAIIEGDSMRTSGSQYIPSLDEIRRIRVVRFEIMADTPLVRAEVEARLARLRAAFPGIEFEARYGVTPRMSR